MQIGMVGLGRMGANMVRRLLRGGHTAVVFDPDHAAVQKLVAEGADRRGLARRVRGQARVAEDGVVHGAGRRDHREAPSASWARGSATGDAIIDGGNTYFKDDVRRAKELAPKGIAYIDVGTSGGVWGLERGYCLMVGAPADQFARLEPIFKTLAPGKGTIGITPGIDQATHVPASAQEGYLHCGPAGAGHFVKMVHNGIEYGLMQAFAEGFDLMRSANKDGVPGGAEVRLQRRGDRRGVAARQRRRVVAARPDVGGAGREPDARSLHRPRVGLGRRPLDDPDGGRRRRCRCRCSPSRCSRASARARITPSATSCCRRCASSSAATARRK